MSVNIANCKVEEASKDSMVMVNVAIRCSKKSWKTPDVGLFDVEARPQCVLYICGSGR